MERIISPFLVFLRLGAGADVQRFFRLREPSPRRGIQAPSRRKLRHFSEFDQKTASESEEDGD